MVWNKQNIPPAIKQAKSKMKKFTANNYQSWITGKTDIYPIIKHIYRVYGSWNDMKRKVFDNVDILRKNRYNGTEEEAIELLRDSIPFVDRVSYSKIKEYNGGDFPSKNYIRQHFGSWTNMKSLAAGEGNINTYSNKPQECLDCGIGRCRFDYSISECEYF